MSSISGLMQRSSARRARGALLLSLFLTLALSACGGGGFLPPQNATASPTSASTATATPQPGSAFAYAFARGGQVWVAQAGKSPRQLSNLPTSSSQSISSLAWSPDSKHLAFEVTGVGAPVDYTIDTSSGDFSALNLPTTTAAATLGWADNKTVVGVKQIDGNTQFWKTDITTNASSKITQVTGTPQVQILGESIYYSQVDPSSNQLMLHRYDINLNSEGTPVAIAPVGASTLKVNWNVSSDGSRVLTGFKLATSDSAWGNGFWDMNFNDNTDRFQIFTDNEIPFSSFADSDTVTLSFSPDGQTVLVDTNGSVGPISEGIDDSNFTTYSPHVSITSLAGISWAPNSATFALISSGTTSQATIYTLASKSAGKTFVDKANLMQWAPKS